MRSATRVESDEVPVPVFSTVRSRAQLLPTNFAAESLSAEVREFADAETHAGLMNEIEHRINVSESLPYPLFWDSSLSPNDAPDQLVVCRWSVLPKLDQNDPGHDEWIITVVPWAGEGLHRLARNIALSVGTRFFWAEYARSYDAVLNQMPFYQTAVERHLSAITNSGAKRVLDVGCGTASVALPLAKLGCSTTLVDNCPEMLSIAKDKFRKADLLHKCDIHLLSATDMERFENQSFDAVNVLLVLFNISQGKQVVESVVKCVRTGGLLVFTEPLRSFDEEPLLELGQEIVRQSTFPRIEYHWRVVSQAGQRLGQLIRNVPSQQSTTGSSQIRADDLPEALGELGCEVMTNVDSHLGQCRHIIAVKKSS